MSNLRFRPSQWAPIILSATLTGIVPNLASSQAFAHHVSVGGVTASSGPINVISADTIGKGRWSTGMRIQAIVFDSFTDKELKDIALAGFEEVHSTDTTFIASLAFAYGISEDFSLSVIAPYVLRNGIREGELEDGIPEINVLGDVSGFGDLTLAAKYRLINRKENAFSLAILAGLRIPSGKTGELQDNRARFETEFQPGSGSWNPSFGMAVARPVGPLSVNGNILYTVATQGVQKTDLGDNFAYNFGLSYRIGTGPHRHEDGEFERHQAFDLVLELNGEWQERERIDGEPDIHSGGAQLFIAPGLRYVSAQGWDAHLSVALPVHVNLNGIQNDPNARVTFGVGVSF